ncbi:MAG: hypothetical protein ACOCRK_05765 [bacterium]
MIRVGDVISYKLDIQKFVSWWLDWKFIENNGIETELDFMLQNLTMSGKYTLDLNSMLQDINYISKNFAYSKEDERVIKSLLEYQKESELDTFDSQFIEIKDNDQIMFFPGEDYFTVRHVIDYKLIDNTPKAIKYLNKAWQLQSTMELYDDYEGWTAYVYYPALYEDRLLNDVKYINGKWNHLSDGFHIAIEDLSHDPQGLKQFNSVVIGKRNDTPWPDKLPVWIEPIKEGN